MMYTVHSYKGLEHNIILEAVKIQPISP